MHHGPSGKIKRRKAATHRRVQQPAFSPNHVRHWVINQECPQHHEHHHGAELHALGKGAGNQSRSNNRKHQLIDHEGLLRNGVGISRIRRQRHPMQEKMIESADETISFTKAQAVSAHRPQHRHHGHEDETLHHGGKHILLPYQSPVEKRETRPGHHQYQGRAGEHPGVVCGTLGPGRLLLQTCQTAVNRFGSR